MCMLHWKSMSLLCFRNTQRIGLGTRSPLLTDALQVAAPSDYSLLTLTVSIANLDLNPPIPDWLAMLSALPLLASLKPYIGVAGSPISSTWQGYVRTAICDSSRQAVSAVHIKLNTKDKRLEVRFDDGAQFFYSAEYLRAFSPSADSTKRDAHGVERVVSGRRHVGILGLEPVGNYGIRIRFDDLHQAGIYTWNYLYDLGANKFRNTRAYIMALKQRGLTRNPQRLAKPNNERQSSQDCRR